jgi:hypothetical protein
LATTNGCLLINEAELLVVAVILIVAAEDVVHHGRAAADGGDDHVAVDGLSYVGGLMAYRCR